MSEQEKDKMPYNIFDTVSDAAKALGVTISAVSYAKKKGTKTAGFLVELA